MNGGHVEEIKSRLPIEDVIGGYMTLEQAGKYLRARCPFHNEKSASFYVSPDRGTYYCFGCNEKGDIFSFVERYEGLDFKGALQLLANRAGVELAPVSKEAQTRKDKLYDCLESATKFFQKNLEINIPAKDYLKKRGLQDQTIKDFRIGYSIDKWNELTNHLLGLGFSEEIIVATGLGIKGDNGIYDRFRARIMFPVEDSSGRVIAYSARILPEFDDGKSGKYINSPETELYHKSNILYGFSHAKSYIRKHNFSILVEGQFDVVMSHQSGFKNTIAVSGTAFSGDIQKDDGIPTHLGLLSKLSPNMILALDNDEAGEKAQLRIIKEALPIGISLKLIKNISGSKDPADILSSDGGIDVWKDILKQALHPVEALAIRIINKNIERSLQIEMVKNVIIPIIAILPSSVDKHESSRIVEKYFGILIDLVLKDALLLNSKTENTLNKNVNQNKDEQNDTGLTIKEKFWGIYFGSQIIDSGLYKYRQRILDFLDKNINPEDKINNENELKNQSGILSMKSDIEFSRSNKPDSFVEDILLEYQEYLFRAILNKLKDEILRDENNPELIKKQWEIKKTIEEIKEKRRLI